MKRPHIKPYKALHARIYLHGETDSSIAEKVGLSQQQMSTRMQGLCPFDVTEMLRIGISNVQLMKRASKPTGRMNLQTVSFRRLNTLAPFSLCKRPFVVSILLPSGFLATIPRLLIASGGNAIAHTIIFLTLLPMNCATHLHQSIKTHFPCGSWTK